MKKIFSILIILTVILNLTACRDKTEKPASQESTVPAATEPAVTEPAVAATALPESTIPPESIPGTEEWLRTMTDAAAQNDSSAMAALGLAYYEGEVLEKDLTQALKWLQKAADAGNTAVLTRLGDMYYSGEGAEKNLEKAFELYTRAAEAAEPEASEKLAQSELEPLVKEAERLAGMAYIHGSWRNVITLRSCRTNPLILDTVVRETPWIEMVMTVDSYTGYPYGDWYLYAQSPAGKWDHIAVFNMDRGCTSGETVTIHFDLEKPATFQALSIVSVERGMEFLVHRLLDFYVDKDSIEEEFRGQRPMSLEEQKAVFEGKELPLTAQYQGLSYSGPSYSDYSDIEFFTAADGIPGVVYDTGAEIPYALTNGTDLSFDFDGFGAG